MSDFRTLEDNGLSIAGYVEQLLEGASVEEYQEDSGSTAVVPGELNVDQVDVSKVKVNEDIVGDILAHSGYESKPQKSVPKPQAKQKVQEARNLDVILEEFQEVIAKGKSLIAEMTTCGALGVNMAGPGIVQKDVGIPKNDPNRVRKRRKKSRRSEIKATLRRKLNVQ